MNAADIGPVPPSDQRQSALDLFLIFACANIVATTFQTGASLVPAFGLRSALMLVVIGSVSGSLLIALLSAVGPRYGVPSVIAARAALGIRGAGLVALLLYATNFAWIAVNNVIAASACAQIAGGPGSLRAWAVGLGVLSTLIVAGGPRLVARADRFAVPLLALVGAALTVACFRVPSATMWAPGDGSLAWLGGLDIVVGYQVSWVLMFADYSRYTPSGKRAGVAVFLGLALTSLWLMPLGVIASRAAGSSDPGAMLQALKLGVSGRRPDDGGDGDDELREHLHVVAGAAQPGAERRRSADGVVDGPHRCRAEPVLRRVARPLRELHDGARWSSGARGRHPAGAVLPGPRDDQDGIAV